MKKKQPNDGINVKGMFRVNITEDGKLVGDSGWKKNQITNDGFNQYLVASLGALTSPTSKQISHIALATGTAPAATSTSLTGEVEKRAAVTAASSSTSKTLRFTGSFASSNGFNTSNRTIQSIGLFNASSKDAGTLFAGNTFTTSALGSNQNVNFTYDIIFS